MNECATGKRLLEARDNALDQTMGFKLGKLLYSADTPEELAEEARYIEAVNRVHAPAQAYVDHVTVCTVCSINRPMGRYSKPEATA